MRRVARNGGFTLIELMIVVVIIGILASLAIPAFIGYIRRSKTAEASTNVRSLFVGAAAYYQYERWGMTGVTRAMTAGAGIACTVPIQNTGNAVGVHKTQVDITSSMLDSFLALGFTLGDPVYYQYAITRSPGNRCGNAINTDHYVFQALGDLDGDMTLSTFELAAGSDSDNNLLRAPGFFITNELE